MANVNLKGAPFNTIGTLPAVGSALPNFKLTTGDLSDKSLNDYKGKRIVLNIVPSIETGTCAASVRRFNQEAAKMKDTVVLCISRDLPFAQARFCNAENIENVTILSSLRDNSFGKDYGVTFQDGPLEGLFSRSVIIAGTDGKITYTQQVTETTEEPDYDALIAILSQLEQ